MLYSAILSALAKKYSRALRVDPHPVWVIGNEVRLAAKRRHPEAVIRVGGKQLKETWGSDDWNRSPECASRSP